LKSKIILITGATGGIGKETARALARQGHTVVIHGRNKVKTQQVCEEIKSETGNIKVDMLLADLLLLSDVKYMADEFKKKYDRLDVLINNAGAMMNKNRETTKEGLEKTIVVNLLAPFLLTELLLDVLAKSPSARIINVSSEMHKRGGKPDFKDFQLENSYSCARAYGLAKLYLIWISRHLITEIKEKGLGHVTVNFVHPATTNTNFGLDSDKGFLANLIFRVVMPFSLTPEQGAETSIYLATSDEVEKVTGQYYGTKKKLAKVDDKYYSAENEKIVWDYCKQITGPYLDIKVLATDGNLTITEGIL